MILSRRQFLSIGAGATVLAACARSGPPFVESDFQIPNRSPVALLPASNYDVDFGDLIARGLREMAVDVRGKSVLLKPNVVEYETDHAINTNARVVAGAVQAFRGAGAREVVVGEGPGHRRDVEYLLDSTGFHDELRGLGATFVDLNHDDVQTVPTRSWFTGLRSIALPVSVLRADVVVSMPKLKTHHWAGMTCSMKNLFGVVPGAVYGWPKNVLHVHGIDASILDLVATVRPHLAIVDGVVGMEGDGPIMGRPKAVGFLAIGTDPVAVDATCARIMGLDPHKMTYLDAAGHYLGNVQPRAIEQRGESPDRYRTTFDLIDSLTHLRA